MQLDVTKIEIPTLPVIGVVFFGTFGTIALFRCGLFFNGVKAGVSGENHRPCVINLTTLAIAN